MAKKTAPKDTDDQETQSTDQDGVTPATHIEPAAVPGSADLAESAAHLTNAMPGVSENVIEQHANEQQHIRSMAEAAQLNAAGLVDRHGVSFDPAVHEYDESTGEVPTTYNGKLRIAKKGRHKKASSSPSGASTPRQTRSQINTVNGSGATTSELVDNAPSMDERIKSRAVGTTAAHMTINVAVVVGGDEFRPIKDAPSGTDELRNLEMAFGDYFEATGKTDFPPGVALSIALVGYVLPRFAMPKTKTRAQRFGLWVRERLTRFKKPGLKRGQRDVPSDETKTDDNADEK